MTPILQMKKLRPQGTEGFGKVEQPLSSIWQVRQGARCQVAYLGLKPPNALPLKVSHLAQWLA